MRGLRKYSNYYEYVNEVVNKCSHEWLILDRKDFRQYRIDAENDPHAKLPGGKLIKVTPARCKSYSCPICGRKKVYDLMDRLKGKDLKGYRFFTLTLKNEYTKENTEKNLLRIAECFNKLNKALRKKKEYKKLEYFRVVEIGSNGMVHIHGMWNIFISTKILGMLWFQITGDSFKVKPERIKSKGDAVKYLYKYLSKNIAGDQERHDPSLFGLDLINTAALFYENGKRRYSASRNFFPKQLKKSTDYLLYYFEGEDSACVESTVKSIINQYDLKKENFDFSCYDESDLFLETLFEDSS